MSNSLQFVQVLKREIEHDFDHMEKSRIRLQQDLVRSNAIMVRNMHQLKITSGGTSAFKSAQLDEDLHSFLSKLTLTRPDSFGTKNTYFEKDHDPDNGESFLPPPLTKEEWERVRCPGGKERIDEDHKRRVKEEKRRRKQRAVETVNRMSPANAPNPNRAPRRSSIRITRASQRTNKDSKRKRLTQRPKTALVSFTRKEAHAKMSHPRLYDRRPLTAADTQELNLAIESDSASSLANRARQGVSYQGRRGLSYNKSNYYTPSKCDRESCQGISGCQCITNDQKKKLSRFDFTHDINGRRLLATRQKNHLNGLDKRPLSAIKPIPTRSFARMFRSHSDQDLQVLLGELQDE